MAVDLTKLKNKFIEALENVTQEEFEQWLLTKTKPMAQQTAVDWLVEQYAYENYGIEVYEQAKQMEREQKIEFANKYADDVMAGCLLRAEQYYNETYGNNQNK